MKKLLATLATALTVIALAVTLAACTPSNLAGLKYKFDKVEVSFDSSVSQDEKDLTNEMLDEMKEAYEDDVIEFVDETTVKMHGMEMKYTRDGNTIKIGEGSFAQEATLSGSSLISEEKEDGVTIKIIYKKA